MFKHQFFDRIGASYDQAAYVDDWEDSDFVEEMFAKFPVPEIEDLFGTDKPNHEKYVIVQWFYCLFERH